jgi:glycosyltransferase involved in cell wall biosynthesis
VLPIGYRGKTVLTLHEAEPFMPNTLIPPPLVAWWRVMRTISARRAERILTVSHAAKADLVRWMGIHASRIHAVHLGVDLTRFNVTAMTAQPPLSGARYVLWVGRPYPRKNLDTLLDAFIELQRLGRPERLVLIGPPGWNEAALGRRIVVEFVPGAVQRVPAIWNDLPTWYAHAAAFVFPSMQETFGLPILEAMACGTAVIAADIPALREIGGDAAVYVSPTSARALANVLDQFLADGQRRDRARLQGLVHAARFDWQVTASKTLNHLHAALQ